MRTRAIVQAVVNKDAAEAALKEYRDTLMPYLPRAEADDKQQHIKRLVGEVARGPISVTPVVQKQVRSRLKTKMAARPEASPTVEATVRKMYKKLGGFT